MSDWVKTFGTVRRLPRSAPADTVGRPETPAEKVARLEAENAVLRRRSEVETEKKILRQAAKYFAGETNW